MYLIIYWTNLFGYSVLIGTIRVREPWCWLVAPELDKFYIFQFLDFRWKRIDHIYRLHFSADDFVTASSPFRNCLQNVRLRRKRRSRLPRIYSRASKQRERERERESRPPRKILFLGFSKEMQEFWYNF